MTILKSIPRIINPQLLYALARMGHGDEIEIRCDGSSIPDLLKGIMQLFPLDETAPPCMLMGMMEEHKAAGWKTPIWEVYKSLVTEGNGKPAEFIEIERFAFYERAKKAYCVVATGETALYGNLILKKGVIGSA